MGCCSERGWTIRRVVDCQAWPKNTTPMDMIRTAYSALAPFDPDYTVPSTNDEANVRKAVRIVAKAGTMVANGHRIRQGKEVIKPNPEHGTAENFLYIMNG